LLVLFDQYIFHKSLIVLLFRCMFYDSLLVLNVIYFCMQIVLLWQKQETDNDFMKHVSGNQN
jgi:hypothetical protein